MEKHFLIPVMACLLMQPAFSQTLFTCGNSEVSKDEFMRAFNRNLGQAEKKEVSLKEYLSIYSNFKLKVNAAKEMKLDTFSHLRYDVMNFRKRLEDEYILDMNAMMAATGYKKNPAVADEMLYLYADSAAYSASTGIWPVAKQVVFTLTNLTVTGEDWLTFAKYYKRDKTLYKGESNAQLLQEFIEQTVTHHYRSRLEEYNPEFKYRLQEFKEGNLFFEVMGKKVWNKSTLNAKALQDYYESHKDHFVWDESAEVILVQAKSYAYADYVYQNMKTGADWRKIAANSEGMIQGDSSRYEISQLPLPAGTLLAEGITTPVFAHTADNSWAFVKVIKLYPKTQRTFAEAKELVINEYQKHLEENWMRELVMKYPVKVNSAVLQSLIK